MRSKELQKQTTRRVRCGGSKGSAGRGRGLPPTERPLASSPTPLSPAESDTGALHLEWGAVVGLSE